MQKEMFLQSEKDVRLTRNQQRVTVCKLPAADSLLFEILDIYNYMWGVNVLKIGRGDSTRLALKKNNLTTDCNGVEPTVLKFASACAKGLNIYQGIVALFTQKMDYRPPFSWRLNYECLAQKLRRHGDASYITCQDELVFITAPEKTYGGPNA